jgi:hypothetical protein
MLSNIRFGKPKWTGIREYSEQDKIRNARYLKAHPETNRRLAAKHKAEMLQATALWADESMIDEFYRLAQLRTLMTGIVWEVDHIIPLRGLGVRGLHVENNLQVIPKTLNAAKGNRSCKQFTWSEFFH